MIAAAVVGLAVGAVGDVRVVGSGWCESVVAAAMPVVVMHWQHSRF